MVSKGNVKLQVPWFYTFKFVNQDFSLIDNHWTVVQNGVLNGIKEYLNYQFFNTDNLLKYYDSLYKQNYLNPQNTNQIAYNFFNDGKTKYALKILLWANKLFPEDINLYDSIGEMYQKLKNKQEALNYYKAFDRKLEVQKVNLKKDEYDNMKKGVTERIKSVVEKN